MSFRELTPALRKRAEAELNEDVRRTPSDVAALQQWLSKQPHLEAVKPPEQLLLSFLRGCKFSLERTKEKLDMFYTLRGVVPELFTARDPLSPKVQEVLKLGSFLPLNGCVSEDGARPCLLRLGYHDTSRLHLTDIVKVAFMVTEILLLEDDNLTVSGQEMIVDMNGVGVSVLAQFTPALARKIMTCSERGLPTRQRGNHILNTPPGFEPAYAIFRAFLSDKLKKRVQVHNQNYKALHQHIPKEILPEEYGGEDGNLLALTEHWKSKVESYREWFLQQESQHSDERRRTGGAPRTPDTLFGFDGSFRQLELD